MDKEVDRKIIKETKFLIFRNGIMVDVDCKRFAIMVEKKIGKTSIRLGFIYIDHKWDKWVFEPDGDTYYDYECLNSISEFLKEKQEVGLVPDGGRN